jgi:hypothetical protein
VIAVGYASSAVRRLGLASAASLALLLVCAATAQATPSPHALYQALLKTPPAGSLPPALKGATPKSNALARGSKKHHAVGAVVIGNTAAIVGFLVFPTHALALADLKAYPPNTGPNKIVSTTPKGLPQPAFILRAAGNGYESAYAVFVLDNVLVNAWTYGPKGTYGQLRSIVEKNAAWAKTYGTSVIQNTK